MNFPVGDQNTVLPTSVLVHIYVKKKSPRPDSPVQAMIFWPGTRHGRPDVHRARELEPACWNDWDSGFMEATESNTATIGTS